MPIRVWKSGDQIKITCITHGEALEEAEKLQDAGYTTEISRERLWVVRGRQD